VRGTEPVMATAFTTGLLVSDSLIPGILPGSASGRLAGRVTELHLLLDHYLPVGKLTVKQQFPAWSWRQG
jgi:hypothetical protein